MSGSDSFNERKLDGKSLRRSESHYRAVAEATSDGIITINSQSTILLVNPAAEKIFGYTTRELLGRQLTMLMPEYHRHLHRQGIARYLETGNRHLEWGAVQLPGLHKSGEEIALEISFLEFVKDGQRFFTGIVRRVAERNHTREVIRDDHELLRAIVNQTSVGISVVDPGGRFTFANEKYCQIVGRTSDELLKIKMADITHKDDLRENHSLFERAIANGEGFEIEERYVRPDGTCVWVHNCVTVLHDANGEQWGVMAVTLDLTKSIESSSTDPALHST
ncbi:MAG TPA: PAS domain S-box protein [Pyrinomonadaceae bacterium]|nr:PAS domain S-box protein [Pyrinomonadaceae bacterium]